MPSFGPLFTELSRLGNAAAPADTPPGALVTIGSGKSALVFTAERLQFGDREGKEASFTWDMLDFVLPGDLSLSADKVYPFRNIGAAAARVADGVGVVCGWMAAGLFAYLMSSLIYDLFIAPLVWLHTNWGFFGDILDMFAVVLFFMFVGWWLIPVLIGLFATGGMVGAFGHWLGKQVAPLIAMILEKQYPDVENGLHVLGREWIGMPWDPPGAKARDLVLIGVKLRRRGLR